MISIIICSRKNQIDSKFIENIQKTVGAEYELIIIDNSQKKYSIFQAYNLGIERSKGEYLCFMHDDIVMHTNNWGLILELEFKKNPGFTLIGVAGAKVKMQFPTGWWDCDKKYKTVNIIQHEKGKVEKQCFGFENDNLEEVIVIDGVFMVLKKGLDVLFDNELKGFHCYDLYLSCKVNEKKKKIGVTNKILIEHLSVGKLDRKWFFSIVSFHKKYYTKLVLNNRNWQQEIFSGKKYIDHCLRIMGRKKGVFYIFSVLQFSSSIKMKFTLGKYFFKIFLTK